LSDTSNNSLNAQVMILFPNAKVNLSLRVGKKRSDGYHQIQSIMYPIPLFDILEISPSKKLSFKSSGQKIPGESKKNLCLKAFQILNDLKSIPPVNIHLFKNIPVGAGLGGGSADGAFTLKGLNTLLQLGYSQADLNEFAAELGSDCPFFISNVPSLSSGKGEILKPLNLDLSGLVMILINPGIYISTLEAYQKIPKREFVDLEEEINLNRKELLSLMENDFQKLAEEQYPVLRKTREYLIQKGALYAGMTGSGSSYFALFDSLPDLSNLEFKDFPFWQFRLD
jgi:4-diphosphocytidyl-2-C-methyl-D-erythritol kinase